MVSKLRQKPLATALAVFSQRHNIEAKPKLKAKKLKTKVEVFDSLQAIVKFISLYVFTLPGFHKFCRTDVNYVKKTKRS